MGPKCSKNSPPSIFCPGGMGGSSQQCIDYNPNFATLGAQLEAQDVNHVKLDDLLNSKLDDIQKMLKDHTSSNPNSMSFTELNIRLNKIDKEIQRCHAPPGLGQQPIGP